MDHSENPTGYTVGGGGDPVGPKGRAGRRPLRVYDGVEHRRSVDGPFRLLRLVVIVLVVSCLALAAVVWRRLLGDLP